MSRAELELWRNVGGCPVGCWSPSDGSGLWVCGGKERGKFVGLDAEFVIPPKVKRCWLVVSSARVRGPDVSGPWRWSEDNGWEYVQDFMLLPLLVDLYHRAGIGPGQPFWCWVEVER